MTDLISLLVFFHLPILVFINIVWKKFIYVLNLLTDLFILYIKPTKDAIIKLIGFKLFIFIMLGFGSISWTVIFKHTIFDMLLRWITTYFIFTVATSKWAVEYREGALEFSEYLDKKNRSFLKYDWVLHTSLYIWLTILYFAPNIVFFDKVILGIIFFLIFSFFIARAYYIITKKNPWPWQRQAVTLCVDCVKIVAPVATLAIVGPKFIYGPNYRGGFQDHLGAAFTGIRSNSEFHYGALNYEITENPDFKVDDFKIPGTNILDKNKFQLYMLRRSAESTSNLFYRSFATQLGGSGGYNSNKSATNSSSSTETKEE